MKRIINKLNHNSVNLIILITFIFWFLPVVVAFLVTGNLSKIETVYSFITINSGAVIGGFPAQLMNIVSYAFLHAGPVHLLLNLISLSYLGTLVVQVYKASNFIIIYILGAMVAGIASIIFLPFATPTVGASGAIFALAGALLVSAFFAPRFGPSNYVELNTLLPIILLNLVLGFAFAEQVNNVAHVAGLITGAALAYIYPYSQHLGIWWQSKGYSLLNLVCWLIATLSVLSIATKMLIIILN